MRSQLTTLTSADIERFERDGYVVVRQAFSPADSLAMERLWWRELEGTRRIKTQVRTREGRELRDRQQRPPC